MELRADGAYILDCPGQEDAQYVQLGQTQIIGEILDDLVETGRDIRRNVVGPPHSARRGCPRGPSAIRGGLAGRHARPRTNGTSAPGLHSRRTTHRCPVARWQGARIAWVDVAAGHPKDPRSGNPVNPGKASDLNSSTMYKW